MLIKKSRYLLLFLSMLLAVGMVMPLAASAEVIYYTNTKDSDGYLIYTQPAYYPINIIGEDLVTPDAKDPKIMKPSPMQNPKDIFIDNRDYVYVADTGNSRIVEFDNKGNWIRYLTVPESPLNKPEGIFVTKDLDIYVADTGNKRVVHLDKNGKLIKEFKKPESRFIPEGFKYDPIKLVVDKRGFLYIATLGGYQGLLELDPDGNFQGFYGANKTQFSALDAIKRVLYTKEMYANEISKLPGSISSVAVDKDGFIYTTTAGQDIKKNQIKKLDIKGLDMFTTKDEYTSGARAGIFGETRPFDQRYVAGSGVTNPQLIDLAVDYNGNITAIDSSYKYISQYDNNGNLLFFWAGPSSANTTQLGLMKNPIAIDANSLNDLYVLDGQENVVQIFRLSEFGEMVNKANQLTLAGRYEESEQPWLDVLRLNSNFTPAMLGLGKAAYKKEQYENAMYYFEKGGNHNGYSDAFWQIRLRWFQQHFSLLASTVLILGFLYFVFNKITRNMAWRARIRNRKRSTKTLIVQLKHMFYILKHPIDGFSAIRYEDKGSYWSAFIILAGAFISVCISQLFTSFTFNQIVLHRLNLVITFGQFVLVWIGWVVSNYLVSSIYRGEGRFRDVFIGSAYALAPVILVGVPLAIISNVMTNSELAIYDLLNQGLVVWTGLLFFWKIQSMQNYSVSETVINILMSLFAFLIMLILAMITVGLSNDLLDFIIEIYQEVRLR
jgi:DNA-binding beta-propeller fold protein YncE